ncbi:MAG: GvpL/GvpF-family gas vesicle protein 1 [Chloroflexi bacterium RBG_13_56_8]|nr:MAG: GvpL/GvpF-family gas vesicle protein 1 [Chloroflexi bacterium RBG_13_56_8]
MFEAQNPEKTYMYCVIRSSEPREFTTLGIGERGDIVHIVHFEDLAAVVSDSPDAKYEQTRRNMMAHTQVLEEVMQDFTILPIRFGTVAPSEGVIRDKVLTRRFDELHGLLQQMEGQIELGLKAFWYEEIIFREAVNENPKIRELRDRLEGHRPEETYYERIRLGELVEKAMRDKRTEDSERILSCLSPLVRQVRTNTILTDRMILNAAFLMEASRQAEFDAAIQSLDDAMSERIVFKYVGPVPPYNFVNVMVSWND